ncbi:uncharacterized protein NECHADRAFT_88482 [Fusarium vanettenii 77-13-4]|uniref:Uncharacterized protein n=1 Tax=Fusarium vanettenii (strain ATCC MYA-4622 / CBS 123669 / FGSC 9596 / NRRL 45880 / 77-13-4) TaxID=660122 RepID=C7ZBP4_FUSV7|nr:uncharacterized protein NECHADRAFT_88482 [Fusarium vanettenii 77-13-4]EEU38550.1 predicted protein [Fusarium vanettenii 77-13-4]
MDFHKPWWADCPHKASYTEDDIWSEIESDSDLDASDDDAIRSDYGPYERFSNHSRDFEHLAFAAGLIVNKIGDNRLDTFSWDLETCIPEAILGPRGIITTRQKLLRALSIITNPYCYETPVIPATQGSAIDLGNFRKLKSLRWRAPRSEDAPALLSALSRNRRHLERLELDLGACHDDEDGHPSPVQESIIHDSAFLRKLLRIQPTPSMPMFPELRELFLLSTTIGPGLARGLDFDTLVSLRFRDCHGLPGFFATLLELRVQPRIKAFEIYRSDSFNNPTGQEEELEDVVVWNTKSNVLVWECINPSWGASATATTNIEETDSNGVSYGVQDWGSQLRKERVSGGVLSSSVYRLQEEFCGFIEWAFGSRGIRSLRTIAVGDFSATGPCEGRLCISVDSHGMLRVLKGRDKRMAYPLEKFQDFVRSETVSLNYGRLQHVSSIIILQTPYSERQIGLPPKPYAAPDWVFTGMRGSLKVPILLWIYLSVGLHSLARLDDGVSAGMKHIAIIVNSTLRLSSGSRSLSAG